jgi:hypothetical protein
MQKVRCDLTGEDSEWFDLYTNIPKGWVSITFNYSFYKGEQYYNGSKRLTIGPKAVDKLLPNATPQPKEESFMSLLRGFIDDEIADALANQ